MFIIRDAGSKAVKKYFTGTHRASCILHPVSIENTLSLLLAALILSNMKKKDRHTYVSRTVKLLMSITHDVRSKARSRSLPKADETVPYEFGLLPISSRYCLAFARLRTLLQT